MQRAMEPTGTFGKQSPPGKKVLDDLYIHSEYFSLLSQNADISQLVQAAMQIMASKDLTSCNVIKVNLNKQRVSFLQYLNFEEDPFPTLNGSWAIDTKKGAVTFRSYASSLNPPILHRKELLVPEDHPRREDWIATTKMAETLGLFSTSSPIGFKENWARLISEKGFRLENDQFFPIGNETIGSNEQQIFLGETQVLRHLTALSRNTLSAPVQLLIGHGLINDQVTFFDYGCGRGDDLKGLESIGIRCAGWDPHYAQDQPLIESDVVNLGFVINVIEDPAERVDAIQRAFSLASTAMVVSVMLYTSDRPGKPYRDGFLTARNTFQKYFSQDEFKDFLEKVLVQDPIMVGPGIALVFKDKDAEQRFLVNRYKSSNVARRLMSARLSPRLPRTPRLVKIRPPRFTKAEREFNELRPTLDTLWAVTLDLGRFPEVYEITQLTEIQEKISLTRAFRLIRTHYDLDLLEQAAQTRADEIKLYISSLQFGKKAPYKDLEPTLRFDVRHFFGDYKKATAEALKLLLDSGKTDVILQACKAAAADGLGWLDEEHSLQLHVSMVERLPAVLRAYINCGLLLWNNISSIQLVKIHIGSGKLTLLKYDDFDHHPVPNLIKRVKVNIRKIDYDVYDYQAPQYPPSALLFKSRYMHEDMEGYAEQVEFDEQLENTGILDTFESHPTREILEARLEENRLEIRSLKLVRSTRIPSLDQSCGENLKFRQLIECGETQARLQLPNIPLNPDTYNALFDLCSSILDPVIDYFGSINLSYGFSSSSLSTKIDGRIAPKLDQHAAHECNRLGKPVCDRLGAAVDFIVDDENMLEVAQWIVSNTPFDRLYFYGKDRPVHVSYSASPVGQVTVMRQTSQGRRVPSTLETEQFLNLS
jgi:DNA phosphorothioation-associated putative methyltransferase